MTSDLIGIFVFLIIVFSLLFYSERKKHLAFKKAKLAKTQENIVNSTIAPSEMIVNPMDFTRTNIQAVLKNAMRQKFMDFNPSDFESFIGQLFRDNGHSVEMTPYTGDYGADLVISKSDEKTAVQVKRYVESAKVAVKDVNQVIGAKKFYNCDKALVITTSSFSKRSQKLAEETTVELWDWDRLQRFICDTYLGGKDYYTYFEASEESEFMEIKFKFEFIRAEYNQEMKHMGSATVVYADMVNLTDENVKVLLKMPTFISVDNKQADSRYYFTGYFLDGVIYARTRVTTAFIFRSEQVPKIVPGDRIIYKWYEEDNALLTFDLKIPEPKELKSACFIVTVCFGEFSSEYREMILFRDRVLTQFRFGNVIIKAYYKYGGVLARILEGNGFMRKLARSALRSILFFIKPIIPDK